MTKRFLRRVVPSLLAIAFIANGTAVYARGFGGGHFGGGFGGDHFGGFGGGFGRSDGGFGRGDDGFGRDSGFGRGDDGLGRDSGFGRGDDGLGHSDDGFGRGDDGFGRDSGFGGAAIGNRAGINSGFDHNHPNWGFGRISGDHSIDAGHNLHNFDNTYLNNHGNLVRNNFNSFHNLNFNNFNHWGGYGTFYGAHWWGGYPGCWYCPMWGMSTAWMITDWATMAGMLALDAAVQPAYFDYGNNITYNNNQVYYNNAPYASSADYYSQAQTLALSTTAKKPSKSDVWKPLGVYSLVEGDQTNSTMMFQLAINDKGEVGGNYYDMLSDQMQMVKGKLDKKNQRVCWTVGTNKDVVYDTGLGNLERDQAPLLVHFDKNRTQEWLLVRLQRPAGDGQSQPDMQAQVSAPVAGGDTANGGASQVPDSSNQGSNEDMDLPSLDDPS